MIYCTNLGEISQHFRHFVPTLSTANIDDDVAVGVLGQRLWDHSLSTSKSSRYRSSAALHAALQHKGHTALFTVFSIQHSCFKWAVLVTTKLICLVSVVKWIKIVALEWKLYFAKIYIFFNSWIFRFTFFIKSRKNSKEDYYLWLKYQMIVIYFHF